MTPAEDSLDFARRSQISRLEERMRTDLQIDDLVLESAREQVLALVEQFGWRIRAGTVE